nr:hypothetical protein Ade03nite_07140 [Actinoplanes derwentensis]
MVFDAPDEVLAFLLVLAVAVFFAVTFGEGLFDFTDGDGDAVVALGDAAADSGTTGSVSSPPGGAAAASGAVTAVGSTDSVPPGARPATRKAAPITTAVDPAAREYRNRAAAEKGTDVHLGETGQGTAPHHHAPGRKLASARKGTLKAGLTDS